MMRKTPLRSRSLKPRVKHPERTAHIGRMKRTRTGTTALEERHLARLRSMPCIVSGKTPVEIHHLMKAPDKRTRRDHRWAVPLHPLMHRGPKGVHGLGTEELFEKEHGLAPGFLVTWARRAWETTE